jgi:adenylosuccinate lyase
MMQREFLEDLFAFRRQCEQHFATVGTAATLAIDKAPGRQPVHQPHCTVVLNLQALRQFAHPGAGAGRQPLQCQHQLMLVRLEASRARNAFAEAQKATDLVAHFGQRFIIKRRHRFWYRKYIVSRYIVSELATEVADRLESRVLIYFGIGSHEGNGDFVISRYTRPEMGRIWNDENRFRAWLAVEVAATETLAQAGIVPKDAAKAIRERADFSVQRIHEIEAEVRHDVIAFTTAVAEIVGPHSRWFHYGLTSNDVVDTAQALLIRQASEVIAADLGRLSEVLKRRAWEFKDTPMVGRTHGVHAEPITFGFKLANWYSETQRNIERFARATEEMRVGKLSGAVGTLAHLTPELEAKICARVGLKVAEITSQVIQRDRHANYLGTLAVVASSLDMIATEIRHLQRTEVREAEEFFSEKQKGSSAMPHKRNPVTCEQISGLARVVRANAQAGFENVALWHERDISHSSVERVIFPDSTTLVDYMLQKTTNLIDTMFVYPERMLANLESTGGLVFSGQLLLDLVEHGVSREDAYRMVQAHAMRAWKEDLNFRDLVLKDKAISSRVPRAQIERAFDLKRQLKNIDKIFARVFDSEPTSGKTRRSKFAAR